MLEKVFRPPPFWYDLRGYKHPATKEGRFGMAHWHHYIEHFGYIGLFFVLLFGIIGLPVPDEVLLTYVGYNVSLGRMSYVLSVLIALAGATCGITISYLAGLTFGEPVLRRIGPKIGIKEKTVTRTYQSFKDIGGPILFLGYFIPGVRHVTAYIAGILNYSFKRFTVFAYTGALIWVVTFITIGRLFGLQGLKMMHYFAQHLWIIVPCMVLFSLGFWYIRHRKKEEQTP
jgi:membrane protein DedA with SNARE-associated domain